MKTLQALFAVVAFVALGQVQAEETSPQRGFEAQEKPDPIDPICRKNPRWCLRKLETQDEPDPIDQYCLHHPHWCDRKLQVDPIDKWCAKHPRDCVRTLKADAPEWFDPNEKWCAEHPKECLGRALEALENAAPKDDDDNKWCYHHPHLCERLLKAQIPGDDGICVIHPKTCWGKAGAKAPEGDQAAGPAQ